MDIIKDPGAIAARSMDLIEQELPGLSALAPAEKAIVKRLVHTTGDPSIAELIRIHPGAVEAGLNALKQGQLLYTDVNMVKAGIDPDKTGSLGVQVVCPIRHPEVIALSREKGETRAMVAMEIYYPRLAGGIAAIGNAPTALFKLLELAKAGYEPPALVIGIPVGFVGAKESKELLEQSGIPYITVIGTRGGSPLAVAVVNALLSIVHKVDY